MLGAIIGDIAGSRFEWNNYQAKDFAFFTEKCYFTDDSVMTVAVGQAILDCRGEYETLPEKTVLAMRRIGQRYPRCGYGGMFRQWILSPQPKPPYHSFGNGAAMRISPVVHAADSLEAVKQLSRQVTAVTHDHPEGIKGAEAAAVAGYLAKAGATIPEIRVHIHENYYPMDFTLDGIRESYRFNETCQETVPQAIMAFLESTDFEDAIRNAISIGGDSDTLAAITGGIAEAYYGIPQDLAEKALGYLSSDLLETVLAFYGEDGPAGNKKRKGEALTRLTRITRMEGILNGAKERVTALSKALDQYAGMAEQIQTLRAYYGSADWRKDFEDDAAGRIPREIKRGVLSEDAVYDLLSEIDELKRQMKRLGAE